MKLGYVLIFLICVIIILGGVNYWLYKGGKKVNHAKEEPEENWVIDSEITRTNETINLYGSIRIRNGGVLVLENVSLVIESKENGQHWILVEKGGKLIVENSRIAAKEKSKGFGFVIYGTLFANRADFSGMNKEHYGDMGIEWFGALVNSRGMCIFSSDVFINNSKIHNNTFNAVFVSSIDARPDNAIRPKIENTTISDSGLAVYTYFYGYPIIKNSYIVRNGDGINTDNFGLIPNPSTFSNNFVMNNSIGLFLRSFSPKIESNVISQNQVGIKDLSGKSSTYGLQLINNNTVIDNDIGLVAGESTLVYGNNITGNKIGIQCESTCPTIENNIIQSSEKDFFLITNAHPVVLNTTFDEEKVYFGYYDGWEFNNSTLILQDRVITPTPEKSIYLGSSAIP